jgi:GNAT superfamily N-acetyltransferase
VDSLALVRLKLRLEFGVEPDGETLPPARRNVDAQPRVLVSRYAGGRGLFFRYDVPEATRARLRALADARLDAQETVVALLEADAPVEHIWPVRWYTLNEAPPTAAYPDVVLHDGRHVIVVGGIPVAQAWTVAGDERASEVEVETHPDYRRRGYARQVVASWAAHELRQGRIVYYSHLVTNEASAGVTRSLGWIHVADEVEYL